MRVLVIEDERKLAAYLKQGLEAEGFSVDIAFDGEAALDKALSETYDAITLDIMLPKMHGYAVCAELRRQKIWTPILMLTAKGGAYDEADALDIGADDFLRKPFSFVVLIARLRALLRRSASERAPELSVGDLRLDPATHEVYRGSTPIALTPREFSLLEYLLHHVGIVLSKRQIIDHVWDVGYDSDENIVEVYIGYLRKKIDAPFSRKNLETVRGVGYRLVEDGGNQKEDTR